MSAKGVNQQSISASRLRREEFFLRNFGPARFNELINVTRCRDGVQDGIKFSEGDSIRVSRAFAGEAGTITSAISEGLLCKTRVRVFKLQVLGCTRNDEQ